MIPSPNELKAPSLLQPITVEKNGSAVHYLIDASLPLVQVEFAFGHGSMHQKKGLFNSFSMQLLFSGTRSKSQKEIVEQLDLLGVHYQVEMDQYSSGFTLTCSKKNLTTCLKLIEELLSEFIIPQKEFDNYKARRKQEHEINMQKPAVRARVELNERLWGKDHPGGKRVYESDFLDLEREHIESHLRDVVLPSGLQVYVAGSIAQDSMDQLEQMITQYPKKENKRLVYLSSYQENFSEIKEGAAQAAIRLGRSFDLMDYESYFRMKLLFCVYGGYFGSRLMQNLREEKGLTYGVSAGISMNLQSVQCVVSSEVDVNRLEEAFDGIKSETEILSSKLIESKELLKIKNYVKGQLLQASDGVFAQIDLIKLRQSLGLPAGYYKDYVSTIDGTTSEQLLDLAKTYLEYDQFVRVSIG